MTLCTLAVAGRDHRKLQLGLSNQHVEISVTGTVAVHLSGYKLELPSDPESTSSESDDWSDDSDENSDSDDADEAQQGSLSELLAENIGSDASESTDSDFHG